MEKIAYFPSYFALPLFFFWWWFVVCCIDGPTLLFPTWSSCWLAESHCRTLGVGDIISSGLGEPQSGMEILSVWGKGGFFYYYFPFSFKGQLSSGGNSSISLPLDAHVGTFSLLLKLLQPKSAGLFLRNPNKQYQKKEAALGAGIKRMQTSQRWSLLNCRACLLKFSASTLRWRVR